mmetsp:Transcript_29281/g.86721  ORF Transcript_29281/g.86721 Transcript_29281/m.86721 type:complete len:266 (+) Transcript_29281:233-1030(+)
MLRLRLLGREQLLRLGIVRLGELLGDAVPPLLLLLLLLLLGAAVVAVSRLVGESSVALMLLMLPHSSSAVAPLPLLMLGGPNLLLPILQIRERCVRSTPPLPAVVAVVVPAGTRSLGPGRDLPPASVARGVRIPAASRRRGRRAANVGLQRPDLPGSLLGRFLSVPRAGGGAQSELRRRRPWPGAPPSAPVHATRDPPGTGGPPLGARRPAFGAGGAALPGTVGSRGAPLSSLPLLLLRPAVPAQENRGAGAAPGGSGPAAPGRA